ncbi:MAG: DUF2970 domain-containing protein [Pseudomonadales bacterium]
MSEYQQTGGDENKPGEKASFLQVVTSVLAGALGVQSSKNRERDFSQNTFMPYIVGGIVFTIIFVGSLVLLVNVLLRNN